MMIETEEHKMNYEIRPLPEEEEELVQEKVYEYANAMAPSEPHTKEDQLVYKVENEVGSIIGGCIVNIHEWGRAVLGVLWVDERYRGHGLGSMLIRAAEDAAREKGCYYLCLGTVDYMARPLYEKHGFKVFTVNRDIPRGHEGWSLSKRLDQGIPDYIPKDNTAVGRYKVEAGSREDVEAIEEGLDQFCEPIVPEEHEYISLSKKLVDPDGKMIAAVIAGVDGENLADVDGIWVDETYRRQGLGTYLLGVIEREAKENGAYVMLSSACDWAVDFFFKNGFTAREKLEDYPKGHLAYELEKRI